MSFPIPVDLGLLLGCTFEGAFSLDNAACAGVLFEVVEYMLVVYGAFFLEEYMLLVLEDVILVEGKNAVFEYNNRSCWLLVLTDGR